MKSTIFNTHQKIRPTIKAMQIGDVHKTHANIKKIEKYTKKKTRIELKVGVKLFVDWFKSYF